MNRDIHFFSDLGLKSARCSLGYGVLGPKIRNLFTALGRSPPGPARVQESIAKYNTILSLPADFYQIYYEKISAIAYPLTTIQP